jgi:hypothetical protein
MPHSSNQYSISTREQLMPMAVLNITNIHNISNLVVSNIFQDDFVNNQILGLYNFMYISP